MTGILEALLHHDGKFYQTVIILVLAALLDYLIGDPRDWLHPVQVIGWVISGLTQSLIKTTEKKYLRRIAGITITVIILISNCVLGWLIPWLLIKVHPLLGMTSQIILLASCFAARSLRNATVDVLTPLDKGQIKLAREKLSQYVGRDTEELSETEIKRAIFETVTENAVDGVTAPLFYAIVGALIPSCGSVPLALAYKALSTLDSMIGYQKEPFTDIGWFSAVSEDYVTWLPCRLTVLTLAILSGRPKQVLKICWRDAPKDPSPNSGWSECIYAAILGVQVGGINTYKNTIKEKPLLGDPIQPITSEIINQALRLTRICFLLWLAVGVMLILLVS
ncbi:adenosylcobinamide-phosphate synthase CbiB [Chroococcus sp. FPU101]|uniref:adenosylcobinamide-phosphate synthase CbiB n=1 Tax=Chroococcus sp. FPU101 TaxID=1974212 RepID=UPI001A8C72FD|nr:adenosylcobinamide-phosphate synthase CbiB [Chroococcus sp. FPU101]GFE69681.1 cobalamin biosynthesis protein CobD [Chroococcus sp. FPU101]